MKSYRELIKPPDLITLLSTSCGMLSVFFSISKNFEIAAAMLISAVLFDRLDGSLARRLGLGEREFGKELDSLSDAVSFGAAVAIFGYALGLNSVLGILVLLFFVCAGILRLTRFNVVQMEPGYYLGMNITYNGLIFPAFYFITIFLESWRLNIFMAVYLLSGILMLSSVRWKKI